MMWQHIWLFRISTPNSQVQSTRALNNLVCAREPSPKPSTQPGHQWASARLGRGKSFPSVNEHKSKSGRVLSTPDTQYTFPLVNRIFMFPFWYHFSTPCVMICICVILPNHQAITTPLRRASQQGETATAILPTVSAHPPGRVTAF